MKACESSKAIKAIVGFLMYPGNYEASARGVPIRTTRVSVARMRCEGQYEVTTTNLYTTKREGAPQANGSLSNLATLVEVKASECRGNGTEC